jgi:hypothetical protein
MPRAKFPKPSHPLPRAPKRPWGTGSVEQRGRGYLARWRDRDGTQHAEMFGDLDSAVAHLDEAMARSNTPVRQTDLRKLIETWRESAWAVARDSAEGDVGWMIARERRDCADDLEKLLDG